MKSYTHITQQYLAANGLVVTHRPDYLGQDIVRFEEVGKDQGPSQNDVRHARASVAALRRREEYADMKAMILAALAVGVKNRIDSPSRVLSDNRTAP